MLVRALLLEHVPRHYENTKHWGRTEPRWDGLHVSLDGLQLRTKRRWKEVNHGTWTKYDAHLIDPEKELQIQFHNLRSVAEKRHAVDVEVGLLLAASGRVSQWNRGVQLYSFHADSDARIRLVLTCEMELKLDASRFPPDVLLAPRVTDARLELQDFNLHRISSIDGPLVRRLGDNLRDEIEREINERRTKLVEKLNRAIDKKQSSLRLSLHDLVTSGWQRLVDAKP